VSEVKASEHSPDSDDQLDDISINVPTAVSSSTAATIAEEVNDTDVKIPSNTRNTEAEPDVRRVNTQPSSSTPVRNMKDQLAHTSNHEKPDGTDIHDVSTVPKPKPATATREDSELPTATTHQAPQTEEPTKQTGNAGVPSKAQPRPANNFQNDVRESSKSQLDFKPTAAVGSGNNEEEDEEKAGVDIVQEHDNDEVIEVMSLSDITPSQIQNIASIRNTELLEENQSSVVAADPKTESKRPPLARSSRIDLSKNEEQGGKSDPPVTSRQQHPTGAAPVDGNDVKEDIGSTTSRQTDEVADLEATLPQAHATNPSKTRPVTATSNQVDDETSVPESPVHIPSRRDNDNHDVTKKPSASKPTNTEAEVIDTGDDKIDLLTRGTDTADETKAEKPTTASLPADESQIEYVPPLSASQPQQIESNTEAHVDEDDADGDDADGDDVDGNVYDPATRLPSTGTNDDANDETKKPSITTSRTNTQPASNGNDVPPVLVRDMAAATATAATTQDDDDDEVVVVDDEKVAVDDDEVTEIVDDADNISTPALRREHLESDEPAFEVPNRPRNDDDDEKDLNKPSSSLPQAPLDGLKPIFREPTVHFPSDGANGERNGIDGHDNGNVDPRLPPRNRETDSEPESTGSKPSVESKPSHFEIDHVNIDRTEAGQTHVAPLSLYSTHPLRPLHV
jgi:hypothetical protein